MELSVYFIYFIIKRFNGNNVGYRLLIMLEIENNLFYCNYIYPQTYSKVLRNWTKVDKDKVGLKILRFIKITFYVILTKLSPKNQTK